MKKTLYICVDAFKINAILKFARVRNWIVSMKKNVHTAEHTGTGTSGISWVTDLSETWASAAITVSDNMSHLMLYSQNVLL